MSGWAREVCGEGKKIIRDNECVEIVGTLVCFKWIAMKQRIRWKTKQWRQLRHSLSQLHKHHPQMKKHQKVEPKKKAEGPARLVRKLKRIQIYRARLNPVKLKKLKLETVKHALRKKISSYLLTDPDSPLNIDQIYEMKFNSQGRIIIPANFSVTENPKQSYETLQRLVSSLLLEEYDTLILDYNGCHNVELGTQVLQDIILTDFIEFKRRLNKKNKGLLSHFTKNFRAEHIFDESVSKMSFSVGSPVTLKIQEFQYNDVEKSKLRIHDESTFAKLKRTSAEETELEITSLCEYVVNSLLQVDRELSDDDIESLYDVIGEALVNADDHSTTKYRFSIGYFEKKKIEDKEVGLFKLAILNLGRTIYQKFHDQDCPNKKHVERMRQLSDKYTQNRWFRPREFEEETLWTLYALQDGVTSKKEKRGSGTISIIENFFKMKGNDDSDNISRMMIVSGSACIKFDGTYKIQKKTDENGEPMSVMTFNKSGNIEDKPDDAYVYSNDSFFPGTLISVTLLFDKLETNEN